MKDVLPKSLTDLIEALAYLPGVGPRTAERYAQFFVRSDLSRAGALANSLENLHKSIRYCNKTFALIGSDQELSPLYTDPKRDKTIVAVVADTFDIVALEKTRAFIGTYHVIGGLLSPIDGISPEQLRVKELIRRIDQDGVQELILAISASVEGESTSLYIQQQVGNRKVTITRLARGLPIGLDLEYADQITLGRALEGRQSF